MSVRVRIYDAETEELIGMCLFEWVGPALQNFAGRRLMLRDDETARLLGFVTPSHQATPVTHDEHQRGVRHGYRSVRPPDPDDLSSV